ncbi:hypothetical protein C0993_004625, partial [Termitomyces sp. T159_Od127]
ILMTTSRAPLSSLFNLDAEHHFSVSAFPAGTLTPTSKQAAIIHTGPTQVPIETVKAITQTLALGASFYSDFDSGEAYEQFPTDWTNYLESLVSTQVSSLKSAQK